MVDIVIAMNQYKKRRKEKQKERLQAQKDATQRTKINANVDANAKTEEDFYQTMERFVTEKGGILFILHKGLVSGSFATARDDEKKSAVFDFNIGHGTGLSMLFECEKVLSDQSMSLDFHKDAIWFGGSLDESGEKYIGSSYGNGSHSAPVTQRELVDRVNQTIDRCFEDMQKSIEEAKMIFVNASNRMNGYLCKNKIGTYVREKYPEIFREDHG